MLAKRIECHVIEVGWPTPTILSVKFDTKKPFTFVAGQFLSLVIPSMRKHARPIKRLYSLTSPPEESKNHGTYELCVKFVAGGIGSEFLASLARGDRFEAIAPYGDFQYRPPAPERNVCFISTGTGVGPIRSILLSKDFQQNRPAKTLCLVGVRTEEEMLYKTDLEDAGVETVYAVSQPENPNFNGFRGRVTDFLKTLPPSWNWHTTDFYLCGNAQMLEQVDALLKGGHGVKASAIVKEAFSSPLPQNVLPLRKTPILTREIAVPVVARKRSAG